jgi:hypothetical protein
MQASGSIIGQFTTRDLAVAFWALVFLACALSNSEMRRSIVNLVRAFLQWKILLSMLAVAAYIFLSVRVLWTAGLWIPALLKDTVFWFCGTSVALVMRFVTEPDTASMGRSVVAESIAVAVIVEFMVNTYTFHLGVELVLVPLLVLIGALDAFTSHDDAYAGARGCIKALQLMIGVVIIASVGIRVVSDLQGLGSLDTLRDMALPPILSLLFIPCLYGLVLVSKYEQVFLRLNMGRDKSAKLRRYARRRILVTVGLSLVKAERLVRDHSADLMHAQHEADIDRLLDDVT